MANAESLDVYDVIVFPKGNGVGIVTANDPIKVPFADPLTILNVCADVIVGPVILLRLIVILAEPLPSLLVAVAFSV